MSHPCRSLLSKNHYAVSMAHVSEGIFADNTFWQKTGKNARNMHSACICSVFAPFVAAHFLS